MKNLKDSILDLSSGVFWSFVYEDNKNYIKLKFYKPDYTKRKAKSLFLKEVKDFLACGDYTSINLTFPY